MTSWPNAPGMGGTDDREAGPVEPPARELPQNWSQPRAPQAPAQPEDWTQPSQPQAWAEPTDAAREQAQAAPPRAEQQWQATAQPGPNWAVAPSPGWAAPSYLEQAPANGMAVASLVLGITSIVFCWWGIFTLAQVVLAIVFGCIGMGRAAKGARGRGMAIAGLVCGCVGGLFYLGFGIITLGTGFLI